jgi:hypothetical protein
MKHRKGNPDTVDLSSNSCHWETDGINIQLAGNRKIITKYNSLNNLIDREICHDYTCYYYTVLGKVKHCCLSWPFHSRANEKFHLFLSDFVLFMACSTSLVWEHYSHGISSQLPKWYVVGWLTSSNLGSRRSWSLCLVTTRLNMWNKVVLV